MFLVFCLFGWGSFLGGAEYFVSPFGLDTNPGTIDAPFKSLTKAAATVAAGDTCLIREGVYEETLAPARSGTAASPIVFQAYPGEKVVISAMQALSGWVQDAGSVYRTTVDWDLGQKNFILHGSTACDLARWPNNVDGDPWTQDSLRNSGGSASTVAADAWLEYASGIPDHDWSKGGSLYFYGDRPGAGWTTWRAFIKSSTPTRVTFDLNKNPSWIRTVHPPADLGDFFLEGIREALDHENEWYFDPSPRMLYLQIPGGGAPADGAVSMRRRIETIDLRNRNHIEIRDLTVMGGEILISGSGNRLFQVTSLHGNRTRGVTTGFHGNSRSVEIRGSNHVIEKCDIGFGSGTGIWDSGTHTRIVNNYIHDFNYLGDYDAIVMVRDGGGGTLLMNNTIARGGRDAIQMVTNDNIVAYNDVSVSNLIADDCGLFYTLGGPRNTEIHHNWFHDTESPGYKKKAAGIYLDNNSVGFSVHHNVIWNTEWSAIQINLDAGDIDVFNNTLWNTDKAMGAWHAPGTAFFNVRVWNNLADDYNFERESDRQNNVTLTSVDPFVDSANGDFRLKPGSTPVDAGREIAGITDGYTGAAPDVGAYEQGGKYWVPGINWDPDVGPIGYSDSHLTNLSVRTPLADGQLLIVGFVAQGGAKDVLVRAVGPGLEGFVDGYHPDTTLELYRGSESRDQNDDWPSELTDDMNALGAFPLTPGSKDAALLYPVEGPHTAWVQGNGSGIILLEAYDADAAGDARIVNVSARNEVGSGDQILIAGFVVTGTMPRTVLIRGVGPSLGGEPFNLQGVLENPRLVVFDSQGTRIAENDQWPADLTPVFDQLGAFQLVPDSEDAALRITLDPGAYTVQVSGADGGTGEAIVEVYALP